MKAMKRAYCRTYQFCFNIALPILPYREPMILGTVEEVIPVLRKKHISSVLLVTDKNLRNLGLCDGLLKALDREGIAYSIYDETVQNPTMTNVLEAKNLYLEYDCGAIIGFGGGSPMDCAKCVGATVARPKLPIPKMHGVLKVIKKTPPFFAVPTTSGTGSEVTLTSVITDESNHRKYTINDFSLIPDYAVLDYRMTMDLPYFVTSTTGMDALTHAVEAYIGRSTTKYTRKMAEDAVYLIHKHLLTACDEPHNVEARHAMQLAAYEAGVAFSQSYVGYVHAVSHALSGRYHTPHGLANACLLPYFLEEYGSAIDEKLAKLADIIDICDKRYPDKIRADAFRAWVWSMNETLGIPKKIEGIQLEDIPKIVEYADKEANPLYPVPVLMGRARLAKMVKKVMK